MTVDGAWESWTRWSGCSATCGGGYRSRTRQCNSPPPANGGSYCSGSPHDIDSCNTVCCSQVHGKKQLAIRNIFRKVCICSLVNCYFFFLSTANLILIDQSKMLHSQAISLQNFAHTLIKQQYSDVHNIKWNTPIITLTNGKLQSGAGK